MSQLRRLPSNPSLEQLKNQARELQESVRAGEVEARELFEALHPRSADAGAGEVKLADAQLVTARLYGFPSWPRLKEVVEEIGKWTRSPHTQPVGGPIDNEQARHDEFLRLACLNYGRDHVARWRQAEALLTEHPEIAGGSIHAAAAASDGQGAHDWLAKRPGWHRCRADPSIGSPCCTCVTPELGQRTPARASSRPPARFWTPEPIQTPGTSGTECLRRSLH